MNGQIADKEREITMQNRTPHRRALLKRGILTGTAAAALLTALPAAAQQIEEIVVTSRRIEEKLRDVPAAVTAFSAETLTRAGVARANDFIGLTPGVTFVQTAEVADSQVNIRGINGARDAENSFAFIVDGVLLSNPAAFNREFSDLAQIEVLKGPQGAIYGRNAAAGAIIVSTKKPGNEFEGQIKTSYGNNNAFTVQAAAGGPLVKDRVAFRISADYRDTDGHFTNTFLNKKVVDNFKDRNVNARLVFTPNDALKVDWKGRYGKVDGASISFNSVFALPGFTALNPKFFENVNDHEFTFQPNLVPTNEQETKETSLKFDYDIDGMTLTGWALYSDITNNFFSDGTSAAFGFFNSDPACLSSTASLFARGVKLPAPQFLGPNPNFPNSVFGAYTPTTCEGYQYQVRNQEDFSAELRLASRQDQKLRWLVGAYYLHINREVGVSTGIDPGGNFAIPKQLYVARPNPASTEQLVWDRFKNDVYAAFGQLQYNPIESVELSAALRYDREERGVTNLVPTDARSRYISFNLGQIGGSPLNPGLDPRLNPGGRILPKKDSFEKVQPKISARWDINEDVSAFASWGQGFKSGGFNNQGSRATVNLFLNGLLGTTAVNIADDFKKETSNAFEAGLKSQFLNGRINAELTGYYVDVKNMQFFEFFVGPFGLLRVVSNIDKVRIQGIEGAVNVAATDWLSLYGSFNVTDSKIKQNSSRPYTVGNKSPATADYTANLGAQVTLPATDSIDFVGRVDYRLTGPTWFHTVQAQTRPALFGQADYSRTKRESFNTVDLRLGVETAQWSITAYARNLFDEKYLAEVIVAPEFGGEFIHPGARRTYGVEGTIKF
jgi:iron complex outermembrane receptor protein